MNFIDGFKEMVRPLTALICVIAMIMFGFMILGGYRIPQSGVEPEIFYGIMSLAGAYPIGYGIAREREKSRNLRLSANKKK